MTHKLLLASMGAVLACGLAAASAQAAPASTAMKGAKADGGLVQSANYYDGRGRGPWWRHRRWDGDNIQWRRWWWKKNHGRHHDDRRAWQDNDRRGNYYDGRRSRRDW